MKLSHIVTQAVAAAALLASGATQATVLTLPTANEMSVGVYNSFNVYSLDLLEKCAADARCQPQSGLPVQSSSGQIADQAVILIGAGGASNFNSPFAAGSRVDDSFVTPRGNQGTTYSMSDTVNFTGDRANRWDISLDLLQNYLDGNDLVFLFDNNQQGNGVNSFLSLWGQARIVDSAGNTVSGLCFELSNNGAGCTSTGPNPTPAVSEYVQAVSDFCVDKISGAAYKIGTARNARDCPVEAGHASGGYQVTNNQSTATAEFAAFNQALHNAATDIANKGYFLSMNIKYVGNNGGAEGLWICSDCNIGAAVVDVPEPASLPLVLLGLAFGGLSLVRRRK